MQTKQAKTQTYDVVKTVVHEHKAYSAGDTIELTPRQAANWLAAGKLSEQKPAATKSRQTKTEDK
ncbi:hypothetical protein HG263_21560 [Pseudoalteromonas sp. JBTF-M23]|uniref:Uncharacterized protein n=1 Tax=Pseudoalteromonas caenipelagi TaxID=2726988 RepID=A0A849VN72_9GAMM|nr:hypothetical protein [Pseudoalteromonas caenipelagi]NOU53091.1 hypothetical protein [Pseudoalteromonas caenipelagi]